MKLNRGPQKTLEELASDIMAALKDRKSPGARVAVVEELLAADYKRVTIIRIIREAFGVSGAQVDADIRKARENWISWMKKTSLEEKRAKSVARAELISNKAHRRGELKTALEAGKHLDELFGLVKTGLGVTINAEGTDTRFVIEVPPQSKDIDEWAAEQQKEKKKKEK